MAEIIGIYAHERSENLDGFFKAIGVPWIGRKIISLSNPRLEIEKNEDEWMIRTVTTMRTTEDEFTLGVEWEEVVPTGARLKNVTHLEGNGLAIHSIIPNGSTITRKYNSTHEGVLLTMTHEKSGQIAKRYFKRVVAM